MRLLALALLLAPVAVEAAECRDTTFEGASYTLCEVAAGEDLRAGRWRGREKTECGIHFGLPAGNEQDGSGI